MCVRNSFLVGIFYVMLLVVCQETLKIAREQFPLRNYIRLFMLSNEYDWPLKRNWFLHSSQPISCVYSHKRVLHLDALSITTKNHDRSFDQLKNEPFRGNPVWNGWLSHWQVLARQHFDCKRTAPRCAWRTKNQRSFVVCRVGNAFQMRRVRDLYKCRRPKKYAKVLS